MSTGLQVDKWNHMYSAMKDFMVEHERSPFPAAEDELESRLARWQYAQRNEYFAGGQSLPGGRAERLEELPFWSWGAQDEWERQFAVLSDWVTAHPGQLLELYAPAELLKWVVQQRYYLNRDQLLAERAARLVGIPDWMNLGPTAPWVKRYWSLQSLMEAHPEGWYEAANKPFKEWIRNQRKLHEKGWMAAPVEAALEALPCWSW